MRVRIHPAFAVYFLSIAVLRSPAHALCALAALAVHEGAHALAARGTGEPFSQLTLTPFGGVMTYAAGSSPAKGLRGMLVAAAGPAGNYLFIGLIGAVGGRFPALEGMMRQLVMANAAMMLLNLFPALPLDGGRIVFCAAYYAMGISSLLRVLTALGVALGGMLLLLSAYGIAKLGVCNLSLLIVGGYLIACAISSRDVLLGENLYAVVQERRAAPAKGARRAALYRVSADTPLFSLLSAMDRAPAAAFLVEEESGVSLLGERALMRALLSDSGATASDALMAQRAAKNQQQA